MMDKIKVILWDIDGTLLNFEEAEKAATQGCFEHFGLGECTDEMMEKYSKINKGYWEKIERGEISKPVALEARFYDWFLLYGLDTSVAAAFNAEYQIRLGDTVCFYENALETVKACKGKVLQYAVTNGTKVAQDRKLRNSGLIHILDGAFISEDVGVDKPAAEFFERVFEEIGTFDKSSVLIVGDSLTSDMKGGNNAGIVTCWFNPEGKTADPTVHIDHEIQNIGQVMGLL